MTEASTTEAAPPIWRRTWDRALSADEEQKEMESAFGHSYQITALADGGERTVRLRYAQLGTVTVTDVTHDARVRVQVPDRRPAYQLLVSLDGRLDARYLDTDMALTRGKALLFRAEGPVTAWPGAGSRVVGVSFPVSHLHQALQSQLGQQVTWQIPFAPVLDQTTHQGADCIRMLLALNDQLRHDDSLLLNPMVALPYVESLTQALLLSADHPYRQMLGRQAGHARHGAVRIAADLMETEPRRPLTIAKLAAEAHISVRSLQEGFQREFGMTPLGYLRDVRLRRAHADLRAGDPSVTTIAAIARRWGFPHAGRFSARYVAAFGEPPKATLRKRC